MDRSEIGKAMSSQIDPRQIRGARGMLSWSIVDLAQSVGLSISTIRRMEMAEMQPISDESYGMVRAALETAGISLLPDVGEGFGVRLRTP